MTAARPTQITPALLAPPPTTAHAPTTLERLRVLSAIGASGTIAGAARTLSYTPSAVSQHLSSLERESGVSLVERSNRGVTLTAAGVLLVERSRDILDFVRTAFDDVAAHAPQYETTLTIAAFPTAITKLLLPLRAALAPSIRLHIVDAESKDALRALAAREIDGAITDASAHQLLPRIANLTRRPLRSEAIKLVSRPGRIPRTLAEFADSEWVLSDPSSPIGHAVHQLCNDAGFSPNVIVETDDHRSTFDIVGATGAVSIVPELALSDLPADLVVAKHIVLPYTRNIEFATRTSLGTNSAILELTRLLTSPGL